MQQTLYTTDEHLPITSEDSRPPPLAEITGHNFSTDSEPVTLISSSSEVDYISEATLEKGRVKLHSELIEALRNLAANLSSRSGGGRIVQDKEAVLEQAVVEQSQMLDVMQSLIASLETENKSFRERINEQGRTILELARWEAKAKKAQRQLNELSLNSQPTLDVSNYKKTLAEKDKLISKLQLQTSLSNNTRLVSMQASLEEERVRVIELEEEISKKQDKLLKLENELSTKQSVLIDKDSEIHHLRYEINSAKKLETQQQELALQQRASLIEKDSQLTALTKALNDEKKLCEQIRRRYLNSPPKVADFHHLLSDNLSSSTLFEQVIGRDAVTVEIKKPAEDSDIGFTFSKIEAPISSRLPCLVVKSVTPGGIASGLVIPGDELLEINGIFCRGPHQQKAIDFFSNSTGLVKIVLARDHIPSHDILRQQAKADNATQWATALRAQNSPPTASDTVSDMSPPSHPPQIYTLTTVESSSNEPHSAPKETTPDNNETYRNLQTEISNLRDQLDESDRMCLELANELQECQSELETIRTESDLVKSENFELQDQVITYTKEIMQIQQNVSELQSVLGTLQTQVADEQQKTASYHNQNKLLTRQMKETKEECEVAHTKAETLQQDIKKLKTNYAEKLLAEQERFGELEQLKVITDQLKSDVNTKEAKIEELVKKNSELEQNHSQIQSSLTRAESSLLEIKDVSDQATASTELEYKKTLSQLETAKKLLIDAEQTETESKIKLRYLEQAADTANQQLTEAENKKKVIENELSSYKSEVENLTLSNKTLSLGLKQTQGKLEAKECTLNRLQTEVDDLRRNNGKLTNETSQLKAELTKFESSLNSFETEQVRLKENLRNSNAEKDSLFQDLENSIDECTQLQQKLEELEKLHKEVQVTKEAEKLTSLEKSQECSKRMQIELESTKADLDNSKKKVELLKQQLSQSKEKCQLLETSLETSQKDYNICKADRDSLATAKEDVVKRTIEIQKTLDKMTEKLKQNEQMISELNITSAKLEEEVKIEKEQSIATKTSLQDELSRLQKAKKQSDDMTASMEFLLKQEQTKLEDAQSSLKNQLEQVKNLNTQLESLTNQLATEKSAKEASEEKLKTATQKITDNEKTRTQEVSTLQEQIETLTSINSEQKEELQKATASISEQKFLSARLQTTLNALSKEKEEIQKSLNESQEKNKEMEQQNKQLNSQISRLKTDTAQLENTSDSLSSEAAQLRKELRQNEREIDKLSAQIQAAEINLAVANNSLETERKQNTECQEAANYIQCQYNETREKLDEVMIKMQRTTLELHSCNEDKAKMKINLDLRQKECAQLQQSLIETQSAADTLKSKVESLQVENSELSQTVDQLQECQRVIQSSVETAEREHTEHLKAEKQSVSRLNEEMDAMKRTEADRIKQVKKLERSVEEARGNVEQLLAAQEALKASLNALGDEKEVEMLRLNNSCSEIKIKNEELLTEVEDAKKQCSLQEARLKENEERKETMQRELQEFVKEKEKLTQEILVLHSAETELAELHTRVSVLESTLHTKTDKLVHTSQQLEDLKTKLKTAKETITEHQANLSELANVKLELVETSSEIGKLKKQLVDKEKSQKEIEDERNSLLSERDHLLTVLRKLEVEKHTTAVQPPTPQLSRAESSDEIDVKKMVGMLKDKEEEAQRLKDYVDKLLINVVEKAPFLLEIFT